jgi:alkanesulfonate monooxygenase SsuD/methylene tetrahydromethanopterin reductase-like flavin-dependent oxidoreductase (luciferase family)
MQVENGGRRAHDRRRAMIFDLFHSVSDPVVNGRRLGAGRCFAQFLRQVQLAEALGMSTVWCAESHFSSEAQKLGSKPAIPNFQGEVGLNADSYQLFHWLVSHTQRIGLGTAIHNIVGGSGGPIASADRVNLLRFANRELWPEPRELSIGVASGRFPYQNAPFGLVPRDRSEELLWAAVQRIAFYEALEIFLRLLSGETLAHGALARHSVSEEEARAALGPARADQLANLALPYTPEPRWRFEALRLVPEGGSRDDIRIVLGSSDERALALARRFWNVDLFNLSFTPPAAIERLHAQLGAGDPRWSRARLPRTVLVFADPSPARARERAEQALDTYIDAMRGTAQVPDKQVLLERALVGDAAQLREQLAPGAPHGFHPEDRLMLWFEFNQQDGAEIEQQMRYFFERVVGQG